MIRLLTFLRAVYRALDFLTPARLERERARAHQLLLMEGLLVRFVDVLREQNQPVLALAAAQAATAEAFTTWLKGFQQSTNEPTASTSRPDPDGEWYLPDGTPSNQVINQVIPAEFRLAAELAGIPTNTPYDREGYAEPE
jgi:hypothetical protein